MDPNMSHCDMQENGQLWSYVVKRRGKNRGKEGDARPEKSDFIPWGLNLLSDQRLRHQLQKMHQKQNLHGGFFPKITKHPEIKQVWHDFWKSVKIFNMAFAFNLYPKGMIEI